MKLCSALSFVILVNCGSCEYNIYRTSLESRENFNRGHGHISIPIIIYLDETLTARLAKEKRLKTRARLKNVTQNIIKEAENHFLHPSLNYKVHLALRDTKFMKNNTIKKDENASRYLKSFCTWQEKMKIKNKKWWFSILLTGADIFYENSLGVDVRKSTGRSYLGGMCNISKSCVLLEWKPKKMGFLIAHEMGHSLGMSHDGYPRNTCEPYVNIMSNKYHPLYQPKTWSRCSKQDLLRFLRSRKGWCLRENL